MAYPVLPEIPKCPNCNVAYSEERVPQRFACREHDCCRPCAEELKKIGITKCPECRLEMGNPTTDRWLLRLSLFVRKARDAQRKRLRDGKPLTVEAKNAIEQAYSYLERLFGDGGIAANGKLPNAREIPSVPHVQEIECVMCLETFCDERTPVRLSCNHCICAECAGEWTTSCPTCRTACHQAELEVDESLLAMAIFYTDLADTVEDVRVNSGASIANKDVLDVLRELHAYTKRVLFPQPASAANSQMPSVAGSAPDEATAEAEFQRQLALAIAASIAQDPRSVQRAAAGEDENKEEAEFQRRLHEAMQASVEDIRREHTLVREQARHANLNLPAPSRPPPPPPPPPAAFGRESGGYGQGYGQVVEGGLLFCQQCGTQAAEGDRFCMECGYSFQVQSGPGSSFHADAPVPALPVSVSDWLASQARRPEGSSSQAPAEAGPAAGGSVPRPVSAPVRGGKKRSTVAKYLSFGLLKGSPAEVS